MKTPWQEIMRAAERGTGLRLTSDEIYQLSMDDAISTRATLDAFPDEEAQQQAADQANRERLNL